MKEEIEIKQYTHGEGDFWCLMGPFFASRAVRRELGIAMSSDENYTWFVALAPGDEVVGFGAVEIDGDTAVLRHAYIAPEHRDNGRYRQLFAARLAFAKEHASLIKVTTNDETLPLYLEAGFQKTGERGQYTYLEYHV